MAVKPDPLAPAEAPAAVGSGVLPALLLSTLARGGPTTTPPAAPQPTLQVRLPDRDAPVVHRAQTVAVSLTDDLLQQVRIEATLHNPGDPVTIDVAVPVEGTNHPDDLTLRAGERALPCALVPTTTGRPRCEASVVLPPGDTSLDATFSAPLPLAGPPTDPWVDGTDRMLQVPVVPPSGWAPPERLTVQVSPGTLSLPPPPGWARQDDGWRWVAPTDRPEELRVAVPAPRIDQLARLATAPDTWTATSVRTSSVLPDQGAHRYGPEQLTDTSPATAWCEGVGGAGEGSWLELALPSRDPPTPRIRLGLYAGYATSDAHWTDNGRVTALMVSGCDGSGPVVVDVPLSEAPTWFETTVPMPPSPPGRPCLRVELARVEPGPSGDTCLSALVLGAR